MAQDPEFQGLLKAYNAKLNEEYGPDNGDQLVSFDEDGGYCDYHDEQHGTVVFFTASTAAQSARGFCHRAVADYVEGK